MCARACVCVCTRTCGCIVHVVMTLLRRVAVIVKKSRFEELRCGGAGVRRVDNDNASLDAIATTSENGAHGLLRALLARHENHTRGVETVMRALRAVAADAATTVLIGNGARGRGGGGAEHLRREQVANADLVVALGGDGTCLQTSHLLGGEDAPPLMCVNTDPEVERASGNCGAARSKFDSRGSKGALCCCTSWDAESYLRRIIDGDVTPSLRSRLSVWVRSDRRRTERHVYATNDALVAHRDPAATSRFTMMKFLRRGVAAAVQQQQEEEDERWQRHVRSSGFRVCTPTGSTAAMLSAGGQDMFDKSAAAMQYMVREPMDALEPEFVHGILSSEEGELELRWNSYSSIGRATTTDDGDDDGAVFIDGNDLSIGLGPGDIIRFRTAGVPPLLLFEKHDDVGSPLTPDVSCR